MFNCCWFGWSDLYDWFSLLCTLGPACIVTFQHAPSKCFVVVNPMFYGAAKQLFGHLGVKVVTVQWYLGGFVGSDDERNALFVNEKVQQWCNLVQKFADIAVAALSKSLQSEWTFVCAVPKCELLFQDLKHCLESSSLFGGDFHARPRMSRTVSVWTATTHSRS